MIRGALASRYGISTLGRGVIRPASGGWWLSGGIAAENCIAAYQPKGAASLAASYVNLANSGTYDATLGVAPTWDVTSGWIFNGTSQYLNTGIIPTETMSVIVRFSDATTPANKYPTIFGSFATSRELYAHPRTSETKHYYSHGSNATLVFINSNLESGVLAIAALNAYYNGTLEGDMGGWSGTSTLPIFIGARNGGTPAYHYAGKIQALAVYSVDISSYINDVTSAMNAL